MERPSTPLQEPPQRRDRAAVPLCTWAGVRGRSSPSARWFPYLCTIHESFPFPVVSNKARKKLSRTVTAYELQATMDRAPPAAQRAKKRKNSAAAPPPVETSVESPPVTFAVFSEPLPSLPEVEEDATAGHTWAPFLELPPGPPHRRSGGLTHVVSYNVNGVRARMKKDRFLEVITRFDADVLCLQEFRWDPKVFLLRADVRSCLAALDYRYVAYHMSASNVGYAGVLILSRIPFKSCGEGVGDPDLDSEGRLAWVEFEKFFLYNVYGPNSGAQGNLKSLGKKVLFMERLTSKLGGTQGKPSVLCGDFNVARLESDVFQGLSDPRWVGHPSCTPEERAAAQRLLDAHDLVDVQAHLGIPDFTFFRRKFQEAANEGMRLDYFFCTAPFMRYVETLKVHKSCMGSDHRPVSLYLKAAALPELVGGPAPPRTSDLLAAFSQAPTFAIAGAASQVHDLDHAAHYSFLLSGRDQESFNPEDACGTRRHPLDHGHSGRVPFQEMGAYFSGVTEHFVEDTEYIGRPCAAALSDGPIVPLVHLRLGKAQRPVEALVDSGATSCVASYKELSKRLGGKLDSMLSTSGYLPTFRTADGGTTKPQGIVRLHFFLSGVPFEWDVYVMPDCAYPIILGNDFLAAANTSILYGKGRLEFCSPLTGTHVQVPFDTRKAPSSGCAGVSALLSQEDFVLQPGHAKRVEVRVGHNGGLHNRQRVFGHVSQHAGEEFLAVAPGNDTLVAGRTEVLLVNFSRERSLRVFQGQVVANFAEADLAAMEAEYDIYPCDLEKFGQEDFFTDLRSLYAAREPEPCQVVGPGGPSVGSSKPACSIVDQLQPVSTAPPFSEGTASTQGVPSSAVSQPVEPEPKSVIESDDSVKKRAASERDENESRLPATRVPDSGRRLIPLRRHVDWTGGRVVLCHRAEQEVRLAASTTTGVARSRTGPVMGSALITLAQVCRRR